LNLTPLLPCLNAIDFIYIFKAAFDTEYSIGAPFTKQEPQIEDTATTLPFDFMSNGRADSTKKEVDSKLHGWRNNLDLDYRTDLDKEQRDRILDQADGNAPDDHANVVKSDAGKKLKDAAKERSIEPAINGNDYTSSHDRTAVEKNQGYVKSTVFNEEANKDIERMKAMFGYEKKIVEENKLTKALNETEILYKQISNKKFI
jgi:hypothetical protein